MLLPDDPRLEPEPELERVLDPELREDPEELPDQLLLREEEELRVVVLREDELRVLEPEFDPLELPHEEFEREERVVLLRAGEMYSGLVLDDCVDVGRVDVAAGREAPVPTASTPRQMVMGAAGSPVA